MPGTATVSNSDIEPGRPRRFALAAHDRRKQDVRDGRSSGGWGGVHPHDHDVKAPLRFAVLCNIAVACNRATVDFLVWSPMMNSYTVEHGPVT
jgi:methylglyoxal synthase